MQNQVLPPYGSPISTLAVELLTEIWGKLPRASLAQILQVSKGWRNMAEGIPCLWVNLDFGPRYTEADLATAQRWSKRAKPLKLVVTITMDATCPPGHLFPIFHAIQPLSARIRHLSLHAPDHTAPAVHNLLASHLFHGLEYLSILLQCESIFIQYGRLPSHESAAFNRLSLPNLITLHCANFPFIFPVSSPANLTELVMGPYVSDSMVAWKQLAPILESAPSLSRLGFRGIMPSLPPPTALLPSDPIHLPALTSLSFRRVHPDSLARFVRILVAPLLTGLTLELRAIDLRSNMPTTELTALLHDPEFVQQLQTLNIQALWPLTSHGAFFRHFSQLETLRLNIGDSLSGDGLSANFWDNLADPDTDGPASMPRLRHLTLANMQPGHVQELILLRQRASQPSLHVLELLFFRAEEASLARSRTWSGWLSSAVGHLKIPPHIVDASESACTFGLFETVQLI
ncbi:hypothetical protein FB451DRAFT_1466875 [Mycena latifolia]|nr:hypothetical protein FB451DRAFT_1466875 [Mycena latifolia]